MLVLFRHGQSTANVEGIKAGQLDVPLSDEGIAQCKVAAETLRNYTFDAIFTSDLNRCIDSTQLCTAGRYPRDTWHIAEELRERSGGTYEGLRYTEIRKLLAPKQYKLWQRDYFESPPMGESMKDVEDRVVPYLKEHVLPLVNDNKNVLVVSHEVTIMVIIGYIKKIDETEVVKKKIDNAIPYFIYGKVPNGS